MSRMEGRGRGPHPPAPSPTFGEGVEGLEAWCWIAAL